MKYIITGTYVLAFIGLISCSSPSDNSSWRIALKTDQDGETLIGSKEELINSLRSGADLKLGWGWQYEDKMLEHIAFPTWIGITNQTEVYVYLDPQVLSGLNWEELNAHYSDSSLVGKEWRVAINTNGSFDAVWIDRNDHKLIIRKPQRHIMTWWVNQPPKRKAKSYFSKD